MLRGSGVVVKPRDVLASPPGIASSPVNLTRQLHFLTEAIGAALREDPGLAARFGDPKTIAELYCGQAARGGFRVELTDAGLKGIRELFCGPRHRVSEFDSEYPGDPNWGKDQLRRVARPLFDRSVEGIRVGGLERLNRFDAFVSTFTLEQMITAMGFTFDTKSISSPAAGDVCVKRDTSIIDSRRIQNKASDLFPFGETNYIPLHGGAWVESVKDEQGRVVYNQALNEVLDITCSKFPTFEPLDHTHGQQGIGRLLAWYK